MGVKHWPGGQFGIERQENRFTRRLRTDFGLSRAVLAGRAKLISNDRGVFRLQSFPDTLALRRAVTLPSVPSRRGRGSLDSAP